MASELIRLLQLCALGFVLGGCFFSSNKDAQNPVDTFLGVSPSLGNAAIAITPASYAFGSIGVGQNAQTTVTVTNSSDSPVIVSSVTISGAGYAITAQACPAGTLSAGGTCTVAIRFAPTTGGNSAGLLTVAYATTGLNSQSLSTAASFTGFGVGGPTVGGPTNATFPLSNVVAGNLSTFDFNNVAVNPPSDTGVTYTCNWDQVIDGSVLNSAASCTTLPGTAAFNVNTGILSWTPPATSAGTYEIKVTGSNAGGASSQIIVVNVRLPYSTVNLVADFDAIFAAETQSATSAGMSPWKDVTASYLGALSGTTAWAGVGTIANPYRLTFDGIAGKVDFGSGVMTGQNQTMFSTWIEPSTVGTAGAVIVSDGGLTGNGYMLRQSTIVPGNVDLIVGRRQYKDVVLSDAPVGYWRLGDSGSAADISTYGNTGTYQAGVTTGSAGLISTDPGLSATFNGSATGYLKIPDQTWLNFGVGGVSFEAWIKPANANQIGCIMAKRDGGAHQATLVVINSTVNGAGKRIAFVLYDPGSGNQRTVVTNSDVVDGGLHHVVAIGNPTTNTVSIYVDNNLIPTTLTSAGGWPNITTTGQELNIGSATNGAGSSYTGPIQEAAVYNYALSPVQVAAHFKAASGTFYPNSVLASQPSAYWRLDDPLSSRTAADISGHGLTATAAGTVTFGQVGALTGDTDTSMWLAGSGSLTAGDTSSFSFIHQTGVFGISVWIQTTNFAQGVFQSIVSTADTGGQSGFYIYRDNSASTRIYAAIEKAGTSEGLVGSTAATQISDNNWHHIVFTGDGVNNYLYMDGALKATTAIASLGAGAMAAPLRIGTDTSATSYKFNGLMDELAIFNTTLNQQQVTNLFTKGAFTYCVSHTTMLNNFWYMVSGIYNSGSGSIGLFVNGQQECSITPSPAVVFAPASANLTAGASPTGTNFWAGVIANLKVYISGVALGVKNLFDITAEAVRANPLTTLYTTGIVLNLDAANYLGGVQYGGSGCGASQLQWYDMSPNALNGTLLGFTACNATNGWTGTGVPTDPYRLAFNGTSDSVNVGVTNLVVGNQLSVCSWFQTSTMVQYAALVGRIYSFDSFNLSGDFAGATGKLQYCLGDCTKFALSNVPVTDGVWHYACGVYDGTLGSNQIKLYVDDTLQTTQGTGTAIVPINTSDSVAIGGERTSSFSGYYFNGSIGAVQIYSNPLTPAQVKQNCQALAARYQGAVCN